ncbi:hypothetical protein A2U01_0108856, partial [Trifolium medium]|nr:hypothetical protein [Trifolium medium]
AGCGGGCGAAAAACNSLTVL